MDKAFEYESKCWEFESLTGHHREDDQLGDVINLIAAYENYVSATNSILRSIARGEHVGKEDVSKCLDLRIDIFVEKMKLLKGRENE